MKTLHFLCYKKKVQENSSSNISGNNESSQNNNPKHIKLLGSISIFFIPIVVHLSFFGGVY